MAGRELGVAKQSVCGGLSNAAPEWQARCLGRSGISVAACPLEGLVRRFRSHDLPTQSIEAVQAAGHYLARTDDYTRDPSPDE